MVRMLIISMCLFSLMGNAQQEKYIRGGLIRSTLTYSPSFMLNNTTMNYYLTGLLEGFISKNLSVRSEAHYLLASTNGTGSTFFKNSIKASLGIQLHKNINNFDTYIGFLPSFSFGQLNAELDSKGKHPNQFEPSFAIKAGMTVYVWKFFNFFAEATYYNTTFVGLDRINGRADELMISAGLAFNINTVKK